MSKAEQKGIEEYPANKEGIFPLLYPYERKAYTKGYDQATQDIISLIESRISEILGDAQPAPVLRAELQGLIDKIREESK